MQVNVEWVDARERLPEPGEPVATATFGTWPPDFHDQSVAGEDYWLVRPMVFHDLYIPASSQHESEDESHHHNCFVDSDGYIRYPPGGPSDDHITHWAALPFLPGLTTHVANGHEATAALARARETG
ncbi:AQJ64_40280 family protein [Streptomyces albus]|uniref:AQJ64_40280 family protein n=1 Tax=Streptomyces TaxID=1883 RepID=UPI0004BF181B|nr:MULTISPECIES: AQJ64_40280 family protein [unclassified Streptomyces]